MEQDVKKWSEIRRVLTVLKQQDLVSLVGELYNISIDNKHFLNARCSETCAEAIKSYRSLVKQFISPDINEEIHKARAQKAISDYWLASGDPYGKIDLMLYYIECGTQFTIEYGDIDESFYNSLVAMFQKAIAEIKKISGDQLNLKGNFIYRLRQIVDAAKNIGWGYGDDVQILFAKANFK